MERMMKGHWRIDRGEKQCNGWQQQALSPPDSLFVFWSKLFPALSSLVLFCLISKDMHAFCCYAEDALSLINATAAVKETDHSSLEDSGVQLPILVGGLTLKHVYASSSKDCVLAKLDSTSISSCCIHGERWGGRERERERERERDFFVYIYIYACCGVINWSKFWGFQVINWSKSVYVLHCLSKRAIKIGVSTHFLWKKTACADFQSY